MKLFLNPLLLLSIAVLSFSACTKHGGDEEHSANTATINFLSPTSGAIYHHGDSVNIEAHIEGTATLHGYKVWVKKINDTTSYFYKDVHDHNTVLHTSHKWKNTITTPTNMEAIIEVILDHDGHTMIKKAPFRVE